MTMLFSQMLQNKRFGKTGMTLTISNSTLVGREVKEALLYTFSSEKHMLMRIEVLMLILRDHGAYFSENNYQKYKKKCKKKYYCHVNPILLYNCRFDENLKYFVQTCHCSNVCS